MLARGLSFPLSVLAVGVCLSGAEALEARVVPGPAGPEIRVNDEAVMPRCFFGSIRGGSVKVTEDYQPCDISFVPDRDIPAPATLHFRFDPAPGEYWLRRLRLVDVETDEDLLRPDSFASADAFAQVWGLWPQGDANTVGRVSCENGEVHVSLTAPRTGTWPDFHLHSTKDLSFGGGREYRITFEMRADTTRTLRPALYRIEGGVYHGVAGPPGPVLESEIALARDAGIRFVSFTVPTCWSPPEQEPDWEAAEAVCRDVLRIHPQALLWPRVGMNAPDWWLERHPESRMRFEDGSPGKFATVSDHRYREAAATHLEALCRHLCEVFPESFAGIHPCGQNTGEWFYDESWGRPLSGYDPLTQAAWREWLAARGEPGAEQAAVPSAARRHSHARGFLHDPSEQRDLVLFNRFRQEEMSDMVLALAAAARRGTAGTRLVILFYGYSFEFGALQNGATVSGHYDLAPVLESGDVDILCSPLSYFDRMWRGTGACMTTAESVMQAGKLWLNEDDTRTHLSGTRDYGGVDTPEQTRDVLLRNTAQAALRGFGTWWMDLPGLGWFDDPGIWDVQRELMPLERAMLARSTGFAPDIAVVLGERSTDLLSGGSHVVARPLIYESRAVCGRVGAPYGQYLLRDAVAGRVPSRLQIFLAAWHLTAAEAAGLAANRDPGETRVWCYAPGRWVADQVATDSVTGSCTGFRLRPVSVDSAQAVATEVGANRGLAEPIGPDTEVRPLFTVEVEDTDEVWARYRDGSPAIVVRSRAEGPGRDVFVGPPGLTTELVRALASTAGVHLYTDRPAAVWVHDTYLSIHSTHDGNPVVDIGTEAAVHDLLSGERVGTGPRFELDLRPGATRVLHW